MVAVWLKGTTLVVTVNVAFVAPDGIITVGGTVAALFELFRSTTAPAAGAGPLRVTEPVTAVGDPPTTTLGDTETLCSAMGWIFSVAVCEVLPNVAVIVADVAADTAEVVIVKFADVAPAGTVTLVGATALELLDDKVTTVPPLVAAPLNLTVPVDVPPPPTEVGDRLKPVNVMAGVTVRVAVSEEVPRVAVIVAVVEADTAAVLIVKLAAMSPAAIVTLAGGTAQALLDEKVTTAPPAGALPVSNTVPVAVPPAVTLAGPI